MQLRGAAPRAAGRWRCSRFTLLHHSGGRACSLLRAGGWACSPRGRRTSAATLRIMRWTSAQAFTAITTSSAWRRASLRALAHPLLLSARGRLRADRRLWSASTRPRWVRRSRRAHTTIRTLQPGSFCKPVACAGCHNATRARSRGGLCPGRSVLSVWLLRTLRGLTSQRHKTLSGSAARQVLLQTARWLPGMPR